MKNSERQIFTYDLVVTHRAAHATPPDLIKIVEVWKRAFEDGNAKHVRDNGRVIYRVGDIEIDEGNETVCVLIRRTDKSASDAAYSHLNTGALRIAEKTEEEGGDTAAHFVISLKHEKDKPHLYLAFLEAVPYLSHSYVQSVLNGIVRAACKADLTIFTYPHPSGARDAKGNLKKIAFVPHVELEGHVADDFKADLEKGVISGMEFVKRTVKKPLAGNQYLAADQSILRVSVDKKLPQNGRLAELMRVLKTQSANYDFGRISFKDLNQKPHSVEFDLDTGAPQQQLYLKSFMISKIFPLLAQSTDVIVDGLRQPMTQRLVLDRKV